MASKESAPKAKTAGARRSARKTAPRAKPPEAGAPAADSAVASAPADGVPGKAIRIRMYRVGFGDCFLLSLPAGERTEHILVDCGVHSRGNIGTIAAAVDDIVKETKGELALVIATHAHQDHISGFGSCKEVFEKITVREVWLPWTEDAKDPVAVKLKQKQAALTELVAEHFAARPASPQALAAIDNLRGNAKALSFLKSGMGGGKVVYLSAGNSQTGVAGIAGLDAQILGPPRDPKFLARMDPPSDQRFLRLGPGGGEEAMNGIAPFDSEWRCDEKVCRSYVSLSPEDAESLRRMADGAEGLAFALDQAMNNTSVVTLLSYQGKRLLFPGDAQYGNWANWIDTPDAATWLASVTFYKVAHHGSFNATPKAALEKMKDQSFAAMASTQNEPWDTIPLAALMKAVAAKATAVVRSDSIPVKGAPAGPALAELPEGFQQGAFWFDYWIPV